MATGPITDTGEHRAVRADPLPSALERLLDTTPREAPPHRAPRRVLAPWRAPSCPLRRGLGDLWRGLGVRLSPWFPHDRVRGAAFDTQHGSLQPRPSRDVFPLAGGKHPTSSRGLLARGRHEHVVTGHPHHLVVIPPRVTPHHPWPPAPPETGRATSWYRPVTATWASPARHAPPRDASGHRSQRVCEPTEVAPGGRRATWAHTRYNGATIRHGRRLLVESGVGESRVSLVSPFDSSPCLPGAQPSYLMAIFGEGIVDVTVLEKNLTPATLPEGCSN